MQGHGVSQNLSRGCWPGGIGWVGEVLFAHGAEERSDIPKERGSLNPVLWYGPCELICVFSYTLSRICLDPVCHKLLIIPLML